MVNIKAVMILINRYNTNNLFVKDTDLSVHCVQVKYLENLELRGGAIRIIERFKVKETCMM